MNNYAKLIALNSEILSKDENSLQDLTKKIKIEENKRNALVNETHTYEEKKRSICAKLGIFRDYSKIVKPIKKEIINKRFKAFLKKEGYSLAISGIVGLLLSLIFTPTIGVSTLFIGVLTSSSLLALSEVCKGLNDYKKATLKYQVIMNNNSEEELLEELKSISNKVGGLKEDIKEIEVEIQNLNNKKGKQEEIVNQIKSKICFVIEKLETAISSPEVEATINTLYAKDNEVLGLIRGLK